MIRIQIDKWVSEPSFYLRHDSGPPRLVTPFEAVMEFESSMWVHQKALEMELRGVCDLIKIATCMGSHSTLWVGALDGILAPMDAQPQGWMYPNGGPVEPAWFWQWTPSERSQDALVRELESRNPLEDKPTHLKNLVPYQLSRTHGAIAQVQAIDLRRLPHLVRVGVPFVFSK